MDQVVNIILTWELGENLSDDSSIMNTWQLKTQVLKRRTVPKEISLDEIVWIKMNMSCNVLSERTRYDSKELKDLMDIIVKCYNVVVIPIRLKSCWKF